MSINNKILSIFHAVENVKYCIWKDINILTVDLVNENYFDLEYDVLLFSEDKEKFISILEKMGFVLSYVTIPKYKCEIFHITKFTSFGYICFHVYTGIVTGSHFSKEYNFEIPNDLWKSYSLINGAKVLNEDYRFALSVIRVLTKRNNMFSEDIKSEDINNFNNSNKTLSLLLFGINNIKDIERYRYKSKLKTFIENTFYKLFFRLYMYVNYGNKRVENKMKVAFVGTDGSGKSTISQVCYDLLRKKLPVKKAYLGSNFRNFSVKTWFAFILYKSFFRFFSLIGMDELRKFGRSLYELSRMNDIYNCYVKTKQDADKGILIIYDRFPIPGFLDFPKCDIIHNKHISQYNKHYNFWISQQESVDINLITTDIDNIKSRRVMGKGELDDIIKKKTIEFEYINGCKFGNLKVIENNTTINDVIDKVFPHE